MINDIFDMSNISMITIKCPDCSSTFDVLIDNKTNTKVNYCVSCGSDISSHVPKYELVDLSQDSIQIGDNNDF